MINYHDKIFRSVTNTDNGDVTAETIFHYYQNGRVLTGTYQGGSISTGQLLGVVDARGHIDMRYQHLTKAGRLMTGICHSQPEVLADGRIRLYESWQWTSGDLSAGQSTIEEMANENESLMDLR